MSIQLEHRSILAVDIEGFSRNERTNRIQLALHRRLRSLLQTVLEAGGVKSRACEWGDTGDGFLITISAEVSKSQLLDVVVPLAQRLDEYNQSAESASQLRLRVVVHAGEVLRDPKANVGRAAIFACRLLDSAELRACLAATSRSLVVAVSDWIYQEVVRHGYGHIDPAAYRPVVFASKGTVDQAWMHVPGDPDAAARAELTTGPPLGMAEFRRGLSGHASGPVGAHAEEEAAVPVDLPADIVSFIGQELETLGRLLADPSRRSRAGLVVVSAIAGKGGVGKTALAIHAAYKFRELFSDGQLYVNLRGAERQALQPAGVLAQLLRALGVAGAVIPESIDERARLVGVQESV